MHAAAQIPVTASVGASAAPPLHARHCGYRPHPTPTLQTSSGHRTRRPFLRALPPLLPLDRMLRGVARPPLPPPAPPASCALPAASSSRQSSTAGEPPLPLPAAFFRCFRRAGSSSLLPLSSSSAAHRLAAGRDAAATVGEAASPSPSSAEAVTMATAGLALVPPPSPLAAPGVDASSSMSTSAMPLAASAAVAAGAALAAASPCLPSRRPSMSSVQNPGAGSNCADSA